MNNLKLFLFRPGTKYTVSARINSKPEKAITKATIKSLKPFKDVVFTITSDNGKEFSRHTKIATALNLKFYFADHCSHINVV